MMEIIDALSRAGDKITWFTESWWAEKLDCSLSTFYRSIKKLGKDGLRWISTEKDETRRRGIRHELEYPGSETGEKRKVSRPPAAKTPPPAAKAPPPAPKQTGPPPAPAEWKKQPPPESEEEKEKRRQLVANAAWTRKAPAAEVRSKAPTIDQAERDAIVAEALGQGVKQEPNPPQRE
jgi:hypothetical protein